jgi:hypothetical protein
MKTPNVPDVTDSPAAPLAVGLQRSVLPPCPYCGRAPSLEQGKPDIAYPEGYYVYKCDHCAPLAESQYGTGGPLDHAWVVTFPWATEAIARGEWTDAANCKREDKSAAKSKRRQNADLRQDAGSERPNVK